MTLIFASAQQDIQFIVADRRITSNGIIKDDKAYKIIQYSNSKQAYLFLIAYAGLSEYRSWNTLQWFTDTLPTVFNENKKFNVALSEFQEKCEQDINGINNLHQKLKALSIILCGRYNISTPDLNKPEYAHFLINISNNINKSGNQVNDVSREFVLYSPKLAHPKESSIIRAGDLRAVSLLEEDIFDNTSRYIRKKNSYVSKIRNAANYIKRVAGANKNGTISESILGAVLLPSGDSEAFDFTVNSDGVQTMPHILSTTGGGLSNIRRISKSSSEFKSIQNKLSDGTPPRYLILTPWFIEKDERRKPQLDVNYKTKRWVDVTSAYAWEKDKVCPYYGLIIACDADEDVISEISGDENYFILADTQADMETPILSLWLINLINWFKKNGMTDEDAKGLESKLNDKKLTDVISFLKDLLRHPKPGFENIKRHTPRSGPFKSETFTIDGKKFSIHKN